MTYQIVDAATGTTTEMVVVPDRPFLTTPFEEYTVTEGFCLIFFVGAVVAICIKILKGGFSWLR